MIHFDEHIFQMGWFNHQPVLIWLMILPSAPKREVESLEIGSNTWTAGFMGSFSLKINGWEMYFLSKIVPF